MSDSDSTATPAKGYIRYRKVRGTHRMYCEVRGRKVVLGRRREDGDVAYFRPMGVPKKGNESWECIDHVQHTAEAAEEEIQQQAGPAEGTLKVMETDGGYDVINTATMQAVNTTPLSKEEADAIVSGSPVEEIGNGGQGNDTPAPECPSGYTFGQDHDEHEECDECSLAGSCEASGNEGQG